MEKIQISINKKLITKGAMTQEIENIQQLQYLSICMHNGPHQQQSEVRISQLEIHFYRSFLIPILTFPFFSHFFVFLISITRVMCWLRDVFWLSTIIVFFFLFIIDFAAAL